MDRRGNPERNERRLGATIRGALDLAPMSAVGRNAEVTLEGERSGHWFDRISNRGPSGFAKPSGGAKTGVRAGARLGPASGPVTPRGTRYAVQKADCWP
jgi:hypothetical protein